MSPAEIPEGSSALTALRLEVVPRAPAVQSVMGTAMEAGCREATGGRAGEREPVSTKQDPRAKAALWQARQQQWHARFSASQNVLHRPSGPALGCMPHACAAHHIKAQQSARPSHLLLHLLLCLLHLLRRRQLAARGLKGSSEQERLAGVRCRCAPAAQGCAGYPRYEQLPEVQRWGAGNIGPPNLVRHTLAPPSFSCRCNVSFSHCDSHQALCGERLVIPLCLGKPACQASGLAAHALEGLLRLCRRGFQSLHNRASERASEPRSEMVECLRASGALQAACRSPGKARIAR